MVDRTASPSRRQYLPADHSINPIIEIKESMTRRFVGAHLARGPHRAWRIGASRGARAGTAARARGDWVGAAGEQRESQEQRGDCGSGGEVSVHQCRSPGHAGHSSGRAPRRLDTVTSCKIDTVEPDPPRRIRRGRRIAWSESTGAWLGPTRPSRPSKGLRRRSRAVGRRSSRLGLDWIRPRAAASGPECGRGPGPGPRRPRPARWSARGPASGRRAAD